MAEKKPKNASKQKVAVPKPIHTTASPYQKPTIQKAEKPHHDIIVNQLVDALTPIKAYRATQPVLKGQNNKKKRKRSPASGDVGVALTASKQAQRPPILQHTLLGFNHVTRHLEELSTLSAPAKDKQDDTFATTHKQHITAVFLFHPLDDLIYAHLPTLCHTASLTHPDHSPTRLVLLDPAAEKRVADAVGLPRCSVLGVLDNQPGDQEGSLTGVESLLQYVREHVAPVDVPWLKDVKEGKWIGTRAETS